jgi:putative nucleotidyltransferase with HDIG domain
MASPMDTPALVPTREAAWALVCEFVQSDSLRKHMRCVEQAMRAYAAKFGEDVEYWGVAGLIHDFDYEQYPTLDQHVWVGSRILAERGWPADLIRTVQSHADYMDVPREKPIDHALFACD